MYISIASHSIVVTATPQKVWRFYEDCSAWPVWTGQSVDAVSKSGPLKEGTRGFFEAFGHPRAEFKVTQARPPEFLEISSHLPIFPYTYLVTTYEMHPTGDNPEQWQITHKAALTGFCAPLVYLFMARSLKQIIPRSLELLGALVRECECRDGAPHSTLCGSFIPRSLKKTPTSLIQHCKDKL